MSTEPNVNTMPAGADRRVERNMQVSGDDKLRKVKCFPEKEMLWVRHFLQLFLRKCPRTWFLSRLAGCCNSWSLA